MFRKSTLLLAAVLTLASVSLAGPPGPKNLTVLPADTSKADVMKIMKGWNKDLGAKCTDCHTSVAKADEDTHPNKKVSRDMVTLTDEINQKLAAQGITSKTTCFTCHRGAMKLPPPATAPGAAPAPPAGN